MIRPRFSLNFVICFALIAALAIVMGCGSSTEKQAMSDFLKMYSDTVNEYAEADESKRASMQEKMASVLRLPSGPHCDRTSSETESTGSRGPSEKRRCRRGPLAPSSSAPNASGSTSAVR